MIDPPSHQMGKTATMLKMETEPSGTATSLSAHTLGRADRKARLSIRPPF
jgi:hypothetical protein